jgi:hypothetical protein
MSTVKTKSPRRYYVRINGETTKHFDSLKIARKYVRDTYRTVVPAQVLPETVEIIKQVIIEEVIDVFTPQPMQLLMVNDLDKDFYK